VECQQGNRKSRELKIACETCYSCRLYSHLQNDADEAYESILINLKGSLVADRCILFSDDRSLDSLLRILEDGGSLRLLVNGKVSGKVKGVLGCLNDNFRATLDHANGNFSVLVSSRKHQLLKFYFDFINRRKRWLNKLLAFFAPFDVGKTLSDYCWPNTVVTINKNFREEEKGSVDVEREVMDRWSDLSDLPRPRQLHYLSIIKGAHRLSFVFRENSAKPIACVKLISKKDHSAGLLNEFEKLKEIHSDPGDLLSRTTPRPFFKIQRGEELAIAMSYLAGKPVNPGQFRTKRLDRDENMIRSIYQWWKLHQQNARAQRKFDKELFLQRLEKTESLFLNSFPHDTAARVGLAKLKSRLMETDSSETWFGPVHGDFWKENLLCDQQSIQVIDWERSESSGPPIYDLFLFLTTYYEHSDYVRLFAETYLEETDYNAVVKKTLREASEYLCLDGEMAGIMFELFLVEMCVQGPVYFKEKTSFDVQWKERLDFFRANKEPILENNFRLTV
jgi:hypothetical protein